MRKLVVVALCITLPVLSTFAGFYVHSFAQKQTDSENTTRQTYSVGDFRPDFTLPDLGGNKRSIAEWDDKIVLINFWASWCPPCVREIPAFETLYKTFRERDVVVVGIAMDDVDNIQRFLRDVPVSYPQLHGQLNVSDLMKSFGNKIGVLPYTVAINRDGKIASFAPQGELDYQQIEELITPIL